MSKKGNTATKPQTPSQPVLEAASPVSAASHEDVARLAYSYWQARGCPMGSPEEDWRRAEQELHNGQRRAASA